MIDIQEKKQEVIQEKVGGESVQQPQIVINVNKQEQENSTEEVVEEKEIDTRTLIPQGDYRTDPLFYEIANYFGIRQEDYDASKIKVATIVEHVINEVKTNDPSKILLKLREYEDMLAAPDFGERRYEVLYRYIRLAGKKYATEQAMSAFEKREFRKKQ